MEGAIDICMLAGESVGAAKPYKYPVPIGLAAHTGLPAIVITPGGSPGIPQGPIPGTWPLVRPAEAVVVVTVTTGLTLLDSKSARIGVDAPNPLVVTPVDASTPRTAEPAVATGVFPVTG